MKIARILPVALVAAAFVPASAHAAPGCVHQGSTGSLSPPMQLVGGSGNFTAAGETVCSNPPSTGTWSRSGTFVNVVCGTFDLYTGTRHYHVVAWNGTVYDNGGERGTAHFEVLATQPGLCATQIGWTEQDIVGVTFACSPLVCPPPIEGTVR